MNESRLPAFETMLTDVQNQYLDVIQKMDTLKADGRTKSATFRQYLGEKMTLQRLLNLYRQYGLLETP